MSILKIYQVFIDRFFGEFTSTKNDNIFMGGTIQGVISSLDYIKDMGFNTILLSPFTTSTNYHGYHIEDYYTVDHHFGTLDDIQQLIAQSRERDIELILDFVPNHCSCEHPYFLDAITNKTNSKYWKWFSIKDNGDYETFLDFKELPKFNLYNIETAQYLIDVCKYWCELGFNYVRVDHATGVPFEFLERLSKEMKSVNTSIKIFGEVWAQGMKRHHYKNLSLKNRLYKYLFGLSQESLQKDYIGVVDGVLDFEFMNIMIESYDKGESHITISKRLKKHFANYPKDFELILMLDNHDTNRFMYHVNSVEKLLDAIGIMTKQQRSFSMYYGTESAMNNDRNIFNGEYFADLQVRVPFDQNNNICDRDIKKLVSQQ